MTKKLVVRRQVKHDRFQRVLRVETIVQGGGFDIGEGFSLVLVNGASPLAHRKAAQRMASLFRMENWELPLLYRATCPHPEEVGVWLICQKLEGIDLRVIGFIMSAPLADQTGSKRLVVLGVWMFEAYRRRGILTAAAGFLRDTYELPIYFDLPLSDDMVAWISRRPRIVAL